MFKILKKEKLAENTFSMDIHAPEIAKAARPGQFIILRIDEKGERIPLTIAGYNKESLTIVFLTVGATTCKLSSLTKGNNILDIAGPLGTPSEVEKFGSVVLVGGGLGIAPIYPQAKALKKAGNKVIVIIGAKNKKFLFWEDKMKNVCDELIVVTDDGSYGKKGLVTDALKEVIDRKNINRCITIGPPIMMKYCALATKSRVKTIASINTIMVDGMGMCGVCRVNVDSEIKFACVDGPDFDAHKVDFDGMITRNRAYSEEEDHVRRCFK